jgi:hypothetical protein
VPEIAFTTAIVPQVIDRHDAKGPNGGERADLRPSQFIAFVVDIDVLALTTAREGKSFAEHVARVDPITFAISVGSFSRVAITVLSAVVITRVVRPHLVSPSSRRVASAGRRARRPGF